MKTLKTKDFFAVIPAAGQSLRMGKAHKLLLPWKTGTVIASVLNAWLESQVSRVCIVVRQSDTQLQDACWQLACDRLDLVVPPENPRDMKQSVQFGLRHIADKYQPADCDRWLVAPADLPSLQRVLIDQLIRASRDRDCILVPRFGDPSQPMKSGHPVSIPWSFAANLFSLAEHEGLDRLLELADHEWLDCIGSLYPRDVDTPEEYEKLKNRDVFNET